jgi:hypothetical protein
MDGNICIYVEAYTDFEVVKTFEGRLFKRE